MESAIQDSDDEKVLNTEGDESLELISKRAMTVTEQVQESKRQIFLVQEQTHLAPITWDLVENLYYILHYIIYKLSACALPVCVVFNLSKNGTR